MCERPRRSNARHRVSVAAAIATAVLAIGMQNGQGTPARGDDKDQSKTRSTDPGQASYQAFVSEIRQTRKRDDDRLIDLANQVLEVAEDPDRPRSRS